MISRDLREIMQVPGKVEEQRTLARIYNIYKFYRIQGSKNYSSSSTSEKSKLAKLRSFNKENIKIMTLTMKAAAIHNMSFLFGVLQTHL
jgi:hypothetical protein